MDFQQTNEVAVAEAVPVAVPCDINDITQKKAAGVAYFQKIFE